ncbi:MAG: Flp family type IVb pilin [Armatimonadota bacterium]
MLREVMEVVRRVAGLLTDEHGGTMVEYSLMVVLIAAVSVAIVRSLGVKVQGEFTPVTNYLP